MNEFMMIEHKIKQQFHLLAEETHRTESEIIHEALAGYLAADRHYRELVISQYPYIVK